MNTVQLADFNDCSPNMKWHVHVGLHKTATTHIQDTFSKRDSIFTDSSCKNVPTSEIRSTFEFRRVPRPILSRVVAKFDYELGNMLAVKSASFVEKCVSELESLIAYGNNVNRVILSDENLLGTLDQVCRVAKYRDFHRLEILQKAIGSDGCALFVCLREPGGFVSSAYAQALRTLPKHYLRIDRVRKYLSEGKFSYLPLIAKLSKIFSGSPIFVWDYDLYKFSSCEIQRMISGVPGFPESKTDIPMSTRSPSFVGVEYAEKVLESNPKKRYALIEEVYARYPIRSNSDRFSLIEPETARFVRESYKDELIALKSVSNVFVIDSFT